MSWRPFKRERGFPRLLARWFNKRFQDKKSVIGSCRMKSEQMTIKKADIDDSVNEIHIYITAERTFKVVIHGIYGKIAERYLRVNPNAKSCLM